MRPVPIPDQAIWHGAVRRVFAAPDSDLTNDTIRPVEVLLDVVADGTPRINVCCQLEDGDLEKLTAGGHVWISFYGGALIPFSTDVTDPLTTEGNPT